MRNVLLFRRKSSNDQLFVDVRISSIATDLIQSKSSNIGKNLQSMDKESMIHKLCQIEIYEIRYMCTP